MGRLPRGGVAKPSGVTHMPLRGAPSCGRAAVLLLLISGAVITENPQRAGPALGARNPGRSKTRTVPAPRKPCIPMGQKVS